MSKSLFLKILVLLILSLFGCSKDKVLEKNTNSLAELIIRKHGNEYFPVIKFKNITKDTLGIYAIGRVRNKNEQDSFLNRMIYDIVLEVEQNEHLIKSTDIGFGYYIMDNTIPKLIILYPDSTYSLRIVYGSDLRKDFGLSNKEFNIRAILESPIEFLSEDSLSNSLLKTNKNVKLIRHKITTQFLKID